MGSTLKFKGWLVTLITVLVFVLQFTAPSRAWTLLFVGLALMQVIGYLWAKILQGHIRLFRERRYTWAQVGDRLEERFTLRNTGPIPALWIEILDHSTLPDYKASQVTGLGTDTFTRWYSDGVCTQRGVFQLGPTEVSLGDPFGLFEVIQRYPNTVDFTIVPPILPLPGLEIAPHSQFGDQKPLPYSPTRSQPSVTVRQYQAGDSLNRIHWPTTARREALYVRGREETSAGDWWLALDLHEAAYSGQYQAAALEKAILLASSLTDKGLSSNHAVGLLGQGEEAIWLPPQKTALQRWKILRSLAQATAGASSLRQLLANSRQMLARNASLVAITASTQLDWLEPIMLLRRQSITPTIILVFTETSRTALENSHQVLLSQGIKTYLVDESALHPPTADHAAGQWEWHITGTGKAVATYKPEGAWERI